VPFTFAVIADSHFHPPGPLTQSAYASDATHNDRNRAAVALIRAAAPAFVVHLGDVPHPVPGLAAHQEALAIARQTYAPLGVPLHVVPGNHDVGDKPHPWSAAPGAGAAKHAVFSEHWGAPYRSFDHGGCHFVLLDTPVMNSGLPLEEEQWAWLEADLAAAAGRPLFAFVHYPPFLFTPDEAEHYDNLAQPARSRLLDLLTRHRASAIFAGHVHHFFYSRFGPTDLYVAPATSFVRPGYSELGRVAPGPEYGRDDAGKLGFFFVHVDDEGGYQVESVRTDGAMAAPERHPALAPGRAPPPALPLAVTLRHAWDRAQDIPCDNLDPFRRKEARNDLMLQATWDLGVRTLRLPIGDLARPETRVRLEALYTRGQRAVVFLVGAPDADTWRLAVDNRHLLEAVELILPRQLLSAPLEVPAGAPPVRLSVVGRRGAGPKEGVYFSHFPTPGFDVDDPDLGGLPPGAVVFRVGWDTPVWEGVAAAAAAAGRLGRQAVATVWLPRRAEGEAFTDDAAVAARVVTAFAAARAAPQVAVELDSLVDHDRGYWPRHGLLDRRSNPRPAFHALRHLSRLFPGPCAVERLAGGYLSLVGERRGVLLPRGPEAAAPALLDLVTGARGGRPGWPAVELDS
jgi:3',5'-cyclic AMP phosphodiesterase CpdA